MRLHHVDTLLEAALAAANAGGRPDTAAWVQRAAATAKECGALVLERRARDLARRLGAAVDASSGTAPPPLPAGLTQREAEVLRLLAHGFSNAELATELFISRKTASVHVSSILGKLGVANRGAAGARARELGLS